MIDDFVSVEEIARRCRISHVTARRRLRKGLIPGRVEHHGTARVERKTFEVWLACQGSRK